MDVKLKKQEYMEKSILFSTCALVKGKIYAITNIDNIPLVMDLKSEEISINDHLHGYNKSFTADEMICDGKDIYIFSLDGKSIMHFDAEGSSCQYYEIDCGEQAWGNYTAIAKYREFLYIFPKYKNAVIRFDTKTKAVKKESKLFNKMAENVKADGKNPFFVCGCQSENKVWFLHSLGNLIVAYDMEQDRWEEYALPLRIMDCVYVVKYNNILYILSSEGRIYCWSVTEKFIWLLAECSNEVNKVWEFGRIVVTDEKIIVLPALGTDIVLFSLDGMQMDIYHDFPKDFQYCGPSNWSKYYGYCEDEVHYYFGLRCMTHIMCIEKQHGEIKWIKPKLPAFADYMKYKLSAFTDHKKYKGDLVRETSWGLLEFLSGVDSDGEYNQWSDSVDVGQRIWKLMQDV